MARPPRIDYPGAAHHLMNRGADHQTTFRNDDDRQLFLTLWAQAVVRFGIVVVSFCLMDNHYHALVISPDGQLSETLQFIGRSYTQQFNHHHDRDGALFRGRFHSVLIDSDMYFERVARYIELNPVAAGIQPLQSLERYPWSSFQYYTGLNKTPDWLSTSRVLERYVRPEQFERFVLSGLSDGELQTFYQRSIQPGRVLGRTEFVERVEVQNPSLAGLIRPGIPEIPLDAIEAAVLTISGAEPSSLRTSTRGQSNVPRSLVAELGQLLARAPLALIAEKYAFPSAQAVSNAIGRLDTVADYQAVALRTAVLSALGRRPDGTPA